MQKAERIQDADLGYDRRIRPEKNTENAKDGRNEKERVHRFRFKASLDNGFSSRPILLSPAESYGTDSLSLGRKIGIWDIALLKRYILKASHPFQKFSVTGLRMWNTALHLPLRLNPIGMSRRETTHSKSALNFFVNRQKGFLLSSAVPGPSHL